MEDYNKGTWREMMKVEEMKIHIIGGSGSGKSYLAEKMSKKWKIPHYDLDQLQWDNEAKEYGVKMPIEKRDAMLKEILNMDQWIIEGVYYQWVQESFKKADRIYLMETPERICQFRIIRRFIRRKMGLEKGKKETIKSLIELLKWNHKFYKVNLKEIKNLLEIYEKKVIIVKNKKTL